MGVGVGVGVARNGSVMEGWDLEPQGIWGMGGP